MNAEQKTKSKRRRKYWTYGAITIIVLSLFSLFGGNDSEEQVEQLVEQPAQAVAEENPKEQADAVVEEATPETLPLLKDEVLALVTLDNESKQYENGTFILKDNTLIKADMYFFNEGNGYLDGSAVFSDGKLARIKLTLEDDSGIEEAFAQFGIYDKENIDRPIKMAFTYEYTFNETFTRDNVYRYPYDLD